MKAKRTHLRLASNLLKDGRMPSVFPVPASALTVTFDAHPSSFLVAKSVCCSERCPCRELLLDFAELGQDGHRLKSGLQFLLALNVDRFDDHPTDEPRPPAAEPLVQEFLHDLPAEDRPTLLAEFLDTRKEVQQAVRFVRSHASKKSSALICGEQAFPDRMCHLVLGDRRTLTLLDRYCPKPECTCSAATLKVMGPPYGSSQRKEGEAAHLFTFDLGYQRTCVIAETGALSSSAAEDLCRTLFKDEKIPDWLEIWEWRNRIVKGFRKELETLRPESPAPMYPLFASADRPDGFSAPQRIAPVRPGPNQPCPCGSGRKYKKCCGRLG